MPRTPQNRKSFRRQADYQGWSNYPTWNVALWINNDQGLYEMVKEEVSYLREEFEDEEGREGTYKDAVVTLSRTLEEYFEEQVPTLDGAFGDLLGWAMGEVDWREIAETMFEE